MKIFQQIIAILCLFAAGLILTAAICGAKEYEESLCAEVMEANNETSCVCMTEWHNGHVAIRVVCDKHEYIAIKINSY